VFEKVVKPPYVRLRTALGNAVLDKRYGVDTDGLFSPSELGLPSPDSVRYCPAPVLALLRILPRREVGPDDALVDFGSGKGRMVLQAALWYRFRRVYGVELATVLHEAAERNLEQVRGRVRCRDVRLVHADVLAFPIPDDVTVAVFVNPFGGQMFRTVIERLVASLDEHPRRLRVVYINPREEAALLATGRFRLVRQLKGWRPGEEWSRSNSTRLYESI
jgi:precorrin-6B methylase 2